MDYIDDDEEYFDEDEELFFENTHEPTSNVGTHYDGFTKSDLLAYTRSVFNLKPYTTTASSAKELTDFLTNQWPNNDVVNALNRMRAVIDTPGWGPDLLIKILPDLDVAFFNGLLRNKIQVSWQDGFSMEDLEFPCSGFDTALGGTEFDHLNGICYVYLNRIFICYEPDFRQAMLTTLFHELVVSMHASSKVCLPNICSW